MTNSTQKINKFAMNLRVMWLYIKYQLISKLLVNLLILPIFYLITNLLIKSSGRTNLSSGDYLEFFFSFSGMPLIASGLLLLVLILGIDINTFIILSSLVEEKKLNVKVKDIFIPVFKSLKYFFSPIGLLLVAFVAVIFPLLNIGLSFGALQNFAIPNFITSVIVNNPLYLTAYALLLLGLFLLSIVHIFAVHFILIDHQPVAQALRSSRMLMQRYWKRFIIDSIKMTSKILASWVVLFVVWLGFFILLSFVLTTLQVERDTLTVLIMITILEVSAFIVFIAVPINISVLTKLFYQYNQLEGRTLSIRIEKNASVLGDEDLYRKIKIRTKLKVLTALIVVVVLNITVAIFSTEKLTSLFNTKNHIELIAHRGGGDLGAENTLYSIEKAIDEKVNWTEIDVQRSADGKYVINHDVSFKRVTGMDKKPSEVTLAEIKQLQVTDAFEPNNPPQPVATLAEILDLSKGKIGVFVELKGKTADTQMVDEVVQIIKDKNMLDETVLLSLDYKIIEYTEKHYPEMKTGYLYFFSVGDIRKLQGDYLIMEEREATVDNINAIHENGKKAVVWTVNTPKSIDKFIHSDVDGIITDHIPKVKQAIVQSDKRSHLEIIIDYFFVD